MCPVYIVARNDSQCRKHLFAGKHSQFLFVPYMYFKFAEPCISRHDGAKMISTYHCFAGL